MKNKHDIELLKNIYDGLIADIEMIEVVLQEIREIINTNSNKEYSEELKIAIQNYKENCED